MLIPPKDLLGKLRKEAEQPSYVLDQVRYRVEWAKFQEREKRKEEEALERERGECQCVGHRILSICLFVNCTTGITLKKSNRSVYQINGLVP